MLTSAHLKLIKENFSGEDDERCIVAGDFNNSIIWDKKYKEITMKHTALLIFGFIATSCSFTTETETNNYYSLGIDPDQACILKDYYLENNKTIPESVKKILDENNIEC